jgi:dCMP deaminase
MNKISWDEYYMNIAEAVSTKSPDKIKVGSVLVSNKNNKIISTGYNSTPIGVNNDTIDFNNRDLIKKIMIHSELNCVIYNNSFEECTLYVTRSPCEKCVLVLAAARVNKIIYKDEHKDIEESKKLCKFFNIELIKF